MSCVPKKISLDEWDKRYLQLKAALPDSIYGGPLRRHVDEGDDTRLLKLKFDNSAASLRLWNFLLTEEDRLHAARASGKKIVGTMKDLGTVPVIAYSLPDVVAFYPDGAWWIPCIMEVNSPLLAIADSFGIDESFCPVRAMIGAFVSGAHFPIPDLITCSVGATCDDFSAIAQRLEGMGYPILWWDMSSRRVPDDGEQPVILPGGFAAPASQVEFVRGELERIRRAFEALAQMPLTDEMLSDGIRAANRMRALLSELRQVVFTAEKCPMPALEMLIAEMLAMHFCSDREESILVIEELLDEAKDRIARGVGVLPAGAVRVFWVNPVADLRAMNLLEDCGGRICGTDYLFAHALDMIPEDIEPMEALARMALADPMVGSSIDRAERIVHDMQMFGSEALVISRIPGASHCANECLIIADIVRSKLGVPVVELEVPPVIDSMLPSLRTRIEALIEIAIQRRSK